MNSLELEGKFNRIKGSLKQKYGQLFEDSNSFSEGKLDEIVGKIQEKTGQTKEAIEDEIRNWKEQ